MSETVRLCMIGAGRHSSANIYPYFHFLDGAEVVANADLDLSRAASAARAFGVPRSYADYHEMLDAEKPDGVLVCVNKEFHAGVAVELMDAGFHVYTEKPNAPSLAAALEVLEAQRRTGRICMTAYKKRFAPAYRKAREVIASEGFGEPSLLTVLRTKGYNPERDDPAAEYLLDWGCHVIDLVPWLFGRVRQVTALMTPGKTNSYAVSFLFATGAVGQLAITNRTGGCWEEVTAAGTNMMCARVWNSIEMCAYSGDQPVCGHRPSFTHGATHGSVEQGFVGELREFADAIRELRTPEADIGSTVHTVAIYEAILESVAAGGAVTDVPETPAAVEPKAS